MPITDLWTRLSDLSSAWLLTYLVHSTLLLGAAWVVAAALGGRRLSLEERLWRFALLGAVVTASLQLAAGWQSPMVAGWAAGVDSAPPVNPTDLAVAAAAPSSGSRLDGLVSAELTAWCSRHGMELLTVVWLLGGACLAARRTVSHLRFARRLRGRRPLRRGRLVQIFRRLVAGLAGGGAMRLASSERLEVPIAHGVRRPEVCVPARVERELPVEQQETLVAHEVAHLDRRDPGWLLLYRGIEALLYLQPLNWLAVRRLQEIAEFLCDDWAVARTGRPVTLARCLTRVADWRVAASGPLPAPTMADGGSRLGRRVRRLLDRGYPRPPRRPPGWLPAAACGVLLLTAIVAPGFAPAAERRVPEAAAPEAPYAPAAPSDLVAVPAVVATPPHPPAPPAPQLAAAEATAAAGPAAPVRPAVAPLPGEGPERCERSEIVRAEELRHEGERRREAWEGRRREVQAALAAHRDRVAEELRRLEAELERMEAETSRRIETGVATSRTDVVAAEMARLAEELERLRERLVLELETVFAPAAPAPPAEAPEAPQPPDVVPDRF